jgi:hypothetical protein
MPSHLAMYRIVLDIVHGKFSFPHTSCFKFLLVQAPFKFLLVWRNDLRILLHIENFCPFFNSLVSSIMKPHGGLSFLKINMNWNMNIHWICGSSLYKKIIKWWVLLLMPLFFSLFFPTFFLGILSVGVGWVSLYFSLLSSAKIVQYY